MALLIAKFKYIKKYNIAKKKFYLKILHLLAIIL